MLQFLLSGRDSLKSWRDQYLDSLNYSQDMYSESMISWMPGTTSYLIVRNNSSIGYLILNHNNELVEFYIGDDQLPQKETLFMSVIKHLGIKSIYCKSFDQALLSCCLAYARSNKLIGYLFQYSNRQRSHAIDSTMSVRLAMLDDVAFLNSFARVSH